MTIQVPQPPETDPSSVEVRLREEDQALINSIGFAVQAADRESTIIVKLTRSEAVLAMDRLVRLKRECEHQKRRAEEFDKGLAICEESCRELDAALAAERLQREEAEALIRALVTLHDEGVTKAVAAKLGLANEAWRPMWPQIIWDRARAHLTPSSSGEDRS